MDIAALGKAMNMGLTCWDTLFPVSIHKVIRLDLMTLAAAYQNDYYGAAYSCPGGGYLIVVSDKSVPGAFQFSKRQVPAANAMDGLRR